MPVITVDRLTKDYGGGKGVFDLSFEIEQGEVYGFLGPNGSGKTTTIRHLLGFSRPNSGRCLVAGLDCWEKPSEVQRIIGYLPGEIAFPDGMTGTHYIRFMADMRGLKDLGKAGRLAERFGLDLSGELKRMSKGMKQKTGIVSAFMHDPAILVLDEPTSGLDPLMQAVFVELVREEKSNGKSVLMSSHLLEEVENTCDRIGMIRDGRMAATVDPKELKHTARKTFKVEFLEADDFVSMTKEPFDIRELRPEHRQVVIDIEDAAINELLAALSRRKVKFLSEVKHDLEEHFLGYYEGDDRHDL